MTDKAETDRTRGDGRETSKRLKDKQVGVEQRDAEPSLSAPAPAAPALSASIGTARVGGGRWVLVLNHQGCECFQNELSLFVAKQPKVSHGERSICPTRSSPPVACTAHKILLGTFVLLCSQVFQKVPLDRSPAADAPVVSAPASPARRTRPQPVHFFLAPCACFFVAVVISWLLVLH